MTETVDEYAARCLNEYGCEAGDGCPAWEALRAARACAKAWKAAAELNRKGWLGELGNIAYHPWVFRRTTVENE